MVLTLYKLNASPPSRAILMVINAGKIPDVQYVDVNLLENEHLKEEYQKINPQHTIPMLRDDDFFVWDSHAIAVYLVTKYSKNSALYPTDPKKRAMIDQKLHFDSGVLFPSAREVVVPVVFKGEKSIRPQALEQIKSAYELCEKFFKNSNSPWMAGNELTLADICCVSTVSSLNEILPIDAAEYPKLTAWLNRCREQDFYKEANAPGLLNFRDLIKSRLE